MNTQFPFFEIESLDSHSGARAGVLHTSRARIDTPVFMPVGTQASVKALSPRELEECGSRIILGNAYHLYLRPGDEIVRDAGGLHTFAAWEHAMLTDSGGYQVYSLNDIATVTDEGVTFKSHIDGSTHFFTPERVMEIEHNLGADIIMVFDVCPHAGASHRVVAQAVQRSVCWARRCKDALEAMSESTSGRQRLFGIVQGATDQGLRKECAQALMDIGFPGYAIGGCAVGEPTDQLYAIAAYTAALLPQDRPRYLMGVGKPADIVECIARGVDMFDCVLPTRNARNGSAFTWRGKCNIRNAQYRRDFGHALDDTCTCYACRHFSRAYLRHLYMAGEQLAGRMLSLHNVHFYMELVTQARRHICDGTFDTWKDAVLPGLTAYAVNDGAE
jgi:queuine tRNA-ribosyltransferase